MTHYAISSLSKSAQNFIHEMKLDKDGDGYISSDNGELSELLSQYGAKDIKELAPEDSKGDFAWGTGLFTAGAILSGSTYKAATEKFNPLPYRETIKRGYAARQAKNPNKYTFRESLRKDCRSMARRHNINRGLMGFLTLVGIGTMATGVWCFAKEHPKKALT